MPLLFTESDPQLDRVYEPARLLSEAVRIYIGYDAEVAVLREGEPDARLPFAEAQLAKAKRRFHRRLKELVRAAKKA